MSLRSGRSLLLVGAMTALWVADVAAQAPVGRVHRMVETKRGHDVPTTQLAIVQDSTRSLRYPRLNDGLFYQDLLKMYRGLRLDMRIDRADLETRHVFGTDAGSLPTPAGAWENIQFGNEGIYEIRPDPRQLRGLELFLRSGLMHLELLRGGIAVRAAGTVTHVDGTKVLFVVDRDSTEGLLYLRNGRVSFPDYTDIRVLDGQVYRLRSGQRPQRLTLTGADAKRWRKLAEYNDRTVWSKVIWERTWFRLLVGAAVVGGAVVLDCSRTHLVCGGGNGGGPSQINIVIPLPN